MDHFAYRDGTLCAEAVTVEAMAKAVGTPFYCYSTATLERHYRVIAEALSGLDALICYSVKANSNQAVIATLARLGSGADVVSVGELQRALAAGIGPEKIVFSGVGKTAAEMAAALAAGILQFNVESEAELETLSAVATGAGTTAAASLRVNPDIDAGSHHKISTGRKEDKFGIPWTRAREAYALAERLPGIAVVGLDVHIGSQLTELAPFEQAFSRIAQLVRALRAEGHDIRSLDIGGGLGVPYGEGAAPPLPATYGAVVKKTVGHLGCRLILEPGRLIAGNAGILVSRVLYIKQGESRTFVVLDAAMNDLMRPSLYQAFHRIIPVIEAPPGITELPVDIVGPVCESGDTFAAARPMPPLAAGDLVAVLTAGAYGAVMSSSYNSRPLTPEVLVRGKEFALIRRRQDLAHMLQLEAMPEWFKGAGPAR